MIGLVEYIVRAIENTYIVEMAYDRKKFKDLIDNLSNQLVENWFLIRYCTITNDKNELKNHWKQELRAHISNINHPTFKMDRRKAIEEVLIGWQELNTNVNNNIINKFFDKFIDERIIINDNDKEDIINELINDWLEYGLNDLIDVLSNKTLGYELMNYVDSI